MKCPPDPPQAIQIVFCDTFNERSFLRALAAPYHNALHLLKGFVNKVVHFPYWLGDFVMSLPFAHNFTRQYPNEKIFAVIGPNNEKIFDRAKLKMEKWVFSKSERKKLLLKLKSEKPDEAFILTNSFGSIWPYTLARISTRRGYGNRLTRFLLTHPSGPQDKNITQAKRYLQLSPQNGREFQVPYLINTKHETQAPASLLLFPGAKYGPSKKWSIHSYAELLKLAKTHAWNCYLLGTPEEQNDANAILGQAKLPSVQNLCGKFSLNELLDWLAQIPNPLCLANDSGAMHLMAACGIPTLGLYFSTSAKNTPPAFGPYQSLEAEIDCRPCFKRTCPFQHYACRNKLEVNRVFDSLVTLYKNNST